jgi:hypothetical protein
MQPARSLYDLQLLRRMARACQLAYDLECKSMPEELDAVDYCWFVGPAKKEHIAAVVLKCANVRIVTFQGTNLPHRKDWAQNVRMMRDWIDNFNVKLDTNGLGLPGRVHRGFAKQLEIVWPRISEYLKSHDSPLYVTGHSQGGAIAVLATKLLEREGHRVLGTVTFGAPRAGDQRFVNSLNTDILRVEYASDPIPWVPPRVPLVSLAMLKGIIKLMAPGSLKDFSERMLARGLQGGMDYRTAGNLLYITANREWIKTQTKQEEVKRFMRLFIAGRDIINDHWIETYMSALGDLKGIEG